MPRKKRQLHSDFPHHITARAHGRIAIPVNPETAWEIFSDYLFLLNRGYGIQIHAFMMMPNHIHLIARDPNCVLSEAMNTFMRDTSKEMGRLSGDVDGIWGSRFHSSLITHSAYYLHAYRYLYQNPMRAKMAADVFAYRYSSINVLTGRLKGIIPIEEDHTLFEHLEGTVDWLNTLPPTDVIERVRNALQRKEFKFARCPKTKRGYDPSLDESIASMTRLGPKSELVPYRPVPMIFSMSEISFGQSLVRMSTPLDVTTTSSSMRTPIPRSSSGADMSSNGI